MIIVYIILLCACFLVAGAVWCAYEIGKNVGAHETLRAMRKFNKSRGGI